MCASPGAGPISDPATSAVRRGIAGYLLVEVLVALTIAALSLAALIPFQAGLYPAGVSAAQRADALALAAGRLATLRAALRAGAPVPESGAETVQTGPDGEPLASGGVYLLEWTMAPADGVVLVDVAVRWSGPDGRDARTMLSSAAQPHAAAASAAATMKPELIGLP